MSKCKQLHKTSGIQSRFGRMGCWNSRGVEAERKRSRTPRPGLMDDGREDKNKKSTSHGYNRRNQPQWWKWWKSFIRRPPLTGGLPMEILSDCRIKDISNFCKVYYLLNFSELRTKSFTSQLCFSVNIWQHWTTALIERVKYEHRHSKSTKADSEEAINDNNLKSLSVSPSINIWRNSILN